MAITKRDLPEGTRLVATYKKQAYVCRVEKGDDGKAAYVLEDGKRYTSPSAAGSAVMGGTACNGWRFWSLEGESPKAESGVKTEKPKRETKAKAKMAAKPRKQNGNGKLLSRTASQEGVDEGMTRWFCNACMATFVLPAGETPEACPAGHSATDPELTAPAGPEA